MGPNPLQCIAIGVSYVVHIVPLDHFYFKCGSGVTKKIDFFSRFPMIEIEVQPISSFLDGNGSNSQNIL